MQEDRGREAPDIRIILVAIYAAVHLAAAVATPYEFHRDEFLYFSMGTHLRLFHMDFPPMMALLSELARHTVGVSVFIYRVLPALAGVALFALSLATVRALGGGRSALVLTSIAMLTGPLFLRAASLFHPTVFDQLWWTAALYALVRLEQSGQPRWWWALGAAGGLGLLTKFSIAFIGLGVLAALLLTPRRREFLRRDPWIALAIVLVVGSPSIVGQVMLDFPVLQQMEALQARQLARVTWSEYLGSQPLMLGPAILLAVAGAVALVGRGALARYRSVGIACIVTFLLLGVLHGKPYYAGPLFPVLIAAGAVWVEQLARPRMRRSLTWGVGLVSLAFGIAISPMGLPVVPPAPMARYAAALGVGAATQTNTGGQLPLPQDYADMTGWREKVDAVAAVVASLTPVERERTVLFGRNYGQAGALDLYGRRLGLPPVVSLAGSFYTFGPGERATDVIVTLGFELDEISEHCGSVSLAARVVNPWGVEEERDVPIAICRTPTRTLKELWVAQANSGARWG